MLKMDSVGPNLRLGEKKTIKGRPSSFFSHFKSRTFTQGKFSGLAEDPQTTKLQMKSFGEILPESASRDISKPAC